MKKVIFILGLSVFIVSCGGNAKSGKQIADEVCDCSAKANDLPTTDPNRTKAQNDCATKQQEAWAKVKDDDKKSTEFNARLSECASELIKKSFGQ